MNEGKETPNIVNDPKYSDEETIEIILKEGGEIYADNGKALLVTRLGIEQSMDLYIAFRNKDAAKLVIIFPEVITDKSGNDVPNTMEKDINAGIENFVSVLRRMIDFFNNWREKIRQQGINSFNFLDGAIDYETENSQITERGMYFLCPRMIRLMQPYPKQSYQMVGVPDYMVRKLLTYNMRWDYIQSRLGEGMSVPKGERAKYIIDTLNQARFHDRDRSGLTEEELKQQAIADATDYLKFLDEAYENLRRWIEEFETSFKTV